MITFALPSRRTLTLFALLLAALSLAALDTGARYAIHLRTEQSRLAARLDAQDAALERLQVREAVQDTCIQALAWKMKKAGLLVYSRDNAWWPGMRR